jgi:hypothetical protein
LPKRQAGALDTLQNPTPEMVMAGVNLFVAWQDGELSDRYLSEQCESSPMLESPYQFLARAMWLAMQEARPLSNR